MRDNTKHLTGVIEKLWLRRTEKQNSRKRIGREALYKMNAILSINHTDF